MAYLLSRKWECPRCEGEQVVTDEDDSEVTCPRCGGKGWVISPSMM